MSVGGYAPLAVLHRKPPRAWLEGISQALVTAGLVRRVDRQIVTRNGGP